MEKLLSGLRAAGEPTRLRILTLLAHSELTVSDITQILGQSQPRVSRHLKLLTDANLIDRHQEGTWVYYRLADSGPEAHLAETLVDLLPFEDEVCARDLSRLDAIRAEWRRTAQAYFRKNAANWAEVRSLHVEDEAVEHALLELFGNETVDDVLDIGTGTGRMLQLFAPHCRHGIGIDQSADMLNFARANLSGSNTRHCRVQQGDMYGLEFMDGAFDRVVVHQVLHYAEDPRAVLKEAVRVLAPRGRILVADFAPHGQEQLREEHAHRRLGFADEEINSWLETLHIATEDVSHLVGQELTVSLWCGEKQAL